MSAPHIVAGICSRAATFTPGPWSRNHTGDVLAEGGKGQRVAEVYAYSPAAREANARLIAAAPELLEACKLAFARLKPGDIRKDYSGHVAHVAMAKAIAKAEGSAD